MPLLFIMLPCLSLLLVLALNRPGPDTGSLSLGSLVVGVLIRFAFGVTMVLMGLIGTTLIMKGMP